MDFFTKFALLVYFLDAAIVCFATWRTTKHYPSCPSDYARLLFAANPAPLFAREPHPPGTEWNVWSRG